MQLLGGNGAGRLEPARPGQAPEKRPDVPQYPPRDQHAKLTASAGVTEVTDYSFLFWTCVVEDSRPVPLGRSAPHPTITHVQKMIGFVTGILIASRNAARRIQTPEARLFNEQSSSSDCTCGHSIRGPRIWRPQARRRP